MAAWARNLPVLPSRIDTAPLSMDIASPSTTSESTTLNKRSLAVKAASARALITSAGSDIYPKTIKFEPITTLDIRVRRGYRHLPLVKKMFQMLGIKKETKLIHLVDSNLLGEFSLEDNIVAVQPRSFLNMLDYLSNGVEVPRISLEKGIIKTIKYSNGEYYNLAEITKELFCVHMATQKPRDNVNVAVYYRNHWFYIADNDISSKRTMSIIQQIFNILSGATASSASTPVLTIPVR